MNFEFRTGSRWLTYSVRTENSSDTEVTHTYTYGDGTYGTTTSGSDPDVTWFFGDDLK